MSGVLHNKSKPTLSYNGNKNHSYFDDRSKKISERKEHIVNHKQFDNSSYKHSNQYKPMISANNKWSEKISNERIDTTFYKNDRWCKSKTTRFSSKPKLS